ncbi:MAG: YfaZ family outer membrane protein [Dissulfuribacterales bacterium]
MKRLNILSVLLFIISISMTHVSYADNFNFKLMANRSAIDSGFEAVIDVLGSNVSTGISGIYNEDEYKILFASAMIGNEIFIDGLQGSLGFKGGWGEAEKPNQDGDILNIGFVFSAAYDLSKAYSERFPVTLLSSVCFSPQPLCFQDTDEFLEVPAEIDWAVLEKAALVVSYRYIEIDFKEQTRWEKADSTGYVGLKFSF